MNYLQITRHLTAATDCPSGSRMWSAAMERLGSEICGGSRPKAVFNPVDNNNQKGRGSP